MPSLASSPTLSWTRATGRGCAVRCRGASSWGANRPEVQAPSPAGANVVYLHPVDIIGKRHFDAGGGVEVGLHGFGNSAARVGEVLHRRQEREVEGHDIAKPVAAIQPREESPRHALEAPGLGVSGVTQLLLDEATLLVAQSDSKEMARTNRLGPPCFGARTHGSAGRLGGFRSTPGTAGCRLGNRGQGTHGHGGSDEETHAHWIRRSGPEVVTWGLAAFGRIPRGLRGARLLTPAPSPSSGPRSGSRHGVRL